MAVRVIVIGGGVIGCAVAYRLARDGHDVTLFEREHPGAGASGASAGMIAPQAETAGPAPLLDLGLESRSIYTRWIAEVRAVSGVDPGFRQDGLVLADVGGSAPPLRERLQWQIDRGLAVEPVRRARLETWYGPVGAAVGEAFFLPEEAQVRPLVLVRALAVAAARLGVEIRTSTAVRGLEIVAGRVRGVLTGAGVTGADAVVLAAGCWSVQLGGGIPDLPEVEPVRGQMIELEPARPMSAPLLFTEIGYLVPRGETVAVGSTTERVGLQSTPTAAGVAGLLDVTRRLVPGLANARFVRAWAGLRPGSPDGLPTIGPSRVQGLVLATGHYRNGVLLAPITAEIVAAHLAGRPRGDLAPFSPQRWSRRAPHPAR